MIVLNVDFKSRDESDRILLSNKQIKQLKKDKTKNYQVWFTDGEMAVKASVFKCKYGLCGAIDWKTAHYNLKVWKP